MNKPDDLLPVPVEDDNNVEKFGSPSEERDEEMEEFDTTLPDEPDEIPQDVGDLGGGDDGGSD